MEQMQRGKQAFERRDYASALADFREILLRHPDFADIHHLSGLCLSFLNQPQAALEQFDQAVSLNEAYVEAHINRAITLNELGRFDEAREAFRRASHFEREASGIFPGAVSARLANAHAAVGDLYLEAGAPSQAAEQYRRALELRSHFHDIRNKLAQALLLLGDMEGATTELKHILDGNPDFLAARLNLGLVLFRRGDSAAAAQEWQRCRAQQPGNPQVRAYLAMLDDRAG